MVGIDEHLLIGFPGADPTPPRERRIRLDMCTSYEFPIARIRINGDESVSLIEKLENGDVNDDDG